MSKRFFAVALLLLIAVFGAEGQQPATAVPISSVTGLSDVLAQLNNSIATLQAAINMLTASTQVNNEVLAGTMNGVNALFWLKNLPSQPESVRIYRNGVRLAAGVDYVVSGSTITFTAGAIPQAGDSVTADYVTAPQAVPNSSSLAFGSQSLYFPPAVQTVTFSNPGPAPVVFSNWAVTGANAGSYTISANSCSPTLAAGGTCTVSVAFNPTQTGTSAATLVVSDNAVGSPQTVALSGMGVLTMPTGWTTVVSAANGACLDVAGQAVTNGSLTTTNPCNGSTSQAFQFTPVTGGYKVTEQNSNNQLDVTGGPDNFADGSTVELYTYWGGSNEIWNTQATLDGYFTITVKNSGKCLTANGTSMVTMSCTGSTAQKWSLIPITH